MVFVAQKMSTIKEGGKISDRPTISFRARMTDKNMLTFSNFPAGTLQELYQ
jgi:hypothetical protein